MLTLVGLLFVIVILLLHVRPPKEETPGDSPPGNVTVEVEWPPGWDTDVDLWVLAPGKGAVPVGYSNKGGKYFNLLRDDLGKREDVGESNYEYSYSRGIPAGEYTVNLHLFRNNEARFPVTCIVRIRTSVTRNGELKVVEIGTFTVDLRHVGEEITVKLQGPPFAYVRNNARS